MKDLTDYILDREAIMRAIFKDCFEEGLCREDRGLSDVSEQLDQIINQIEIIKTNLVEANDFLKWIIKLRLMSPDELEKLCLFPSATSNSQQK